MNVYDFDKTIYRTDSTSSFFWYSLRKYPSFVRFAPRQMHALLMKMLGKWSFGRAKGAFLCFFSGLQDPQKAISDYWDSNIKGIKPWYEKAHREDDVVISASPQEIVEEACRRIGIKNVIATRINLKTGELLAANVKGEEKVRRFREAFGEEAIENFYSDSLSDAPMARLAKKAWLVKGGRIEPWPAGSLSERADV